MEAQSSRVGLMEENGMLDIEEVVVLCEEKASEELPDDNNVPEMKQEEWLMNMKGWDAEAPSGDPDVMKKKEHKSKIVWKTKGWMSLQSACQIDTNLINDMLITSQNVSL